MDKYNKTEIVGMKTYCEAVESLKIKAILIALQSLYDSKKYEDSTLTDMLNRFIKYGFDFIKHDKETQEEVVTYLINDSVNCKRNPYF